MQRAKRGNLNSLALLLGKMEGHAEPLGQVEAMQRLGKWSYWLAFVDEKPQGLISWRAENLVGVIREAWFENNGTEPQLVPPLIAGIENESRSLINEVLIFLVAPDMTTWLTPLITSAGFAPTNIDSLHKIWREVVKEHVRETDQIYFKRLREEMVTKPI